MKDDMEIECMNELFGEHHEPEEYPFWHKVPIKEEEEIHWQPVSKFSGYTVDDIYKDLPKAKEYHKNYTKLWLKER